MFQITTATALILLILATSGCEQPQSGGPGKEPVVQVGPPKIRSVNESNYMTGKQFCSRFSKITSQEFGRRIQVPAFYDQPKSGTVEIYAYTLKPFNPELPSYIFIDGGPGQNTHGIQDVTNGAFNEIRFDQRGLGCSAPNSFSLYRNAKFYSTSNTVKDIEAIRKAYGIQKWALFGVSYGTVPATQYGALYPEQTKSVVLEGIVGRSYDVHQWAYKAEKVNLILGQLSPSDRQAFDQLMQENSQDTSLVTGVLFGFSFYNDFGLREAHRILGYVIQDGEIQRQFLQYVRGAGKTQTPEADPLPPQQPGATDDNVLKILFCKELNLRDLGKTGLSYSKTQGFYAIELPSSTNDGQCDSLGVRAEDQVPYQLEDFKVYRPVYYFQGSHDGATMARGAWTHWNTVPQAETYFLLAQKGGHNPNLKRLGNKDNLGLKMVQTALFQKALSGEPIQKSEIDTANIYAKADQKWKFWTTPLGAQGEFDQELEGIHRVLKLGLLQ